MIARHLSHKTKCWIILFTKMRLNQGSRLFFRLGGDKIWQKVIFFISCSSKKSSFQKQQKHYIFQKMRSNVSKFLNFKKQKNIFFSYSSSLSFWSSSLLLEIVIFLDFARPGWLTKSRNLVEEAFYSCLN